MSDSGNGRFPLVEKIKKHGLSKMAMVIIFLLCFGFFTTYILGSFTKILVSKCEASMPYLSCEETGKYLVTIFSVGATLFGPLLTFEWLLKKSFIFLTGLLISIFLIITGSILFLKHRYDSIQT